MNVFTIESHKLMFIKVGISPLYKLTNAIKFKIPLKRNKIPTTIPIKSIIN